MSNNINDAGKRMLEKNPVTAQNQANGARRSKLVKKKKRPVIKNQMESVSSGRERERGGLAGDKGPLSLITGTAEAVREDESSM